MAFDENGMRKDFELDVLAVTVNRGLAKVFNIMNVNRAVAKVTLHMHNYGMDVLGVNVNRGLAKAKLHMYI